MLDSLVQGFSGPGKWFMYAIAIIFAYGLAIFLERTFMYWIRWKKNKKRIEQSIQSGDLASAAHLASPHPVAILIAASSNATNKEEVWDSVAVVAPNVEARVMRQISFLSAIGNIATMIGLLGTVYGLIFALDGLDQITNVERTARLSKGISVAMVTTAWGLITGVPAMAAHAFLLAKAKDILAYCESVTAMLALQKSK